MFILGVFHQTFFQGYLGEDTASPDSMQGQHSAEQQSLHLGTYCHVPAHIHTAPACDQHQDTSDKDRPGSPPSLGNGVDAKDAHLPHPDQGGSHRSREGKSTGECLESSSDVANGVLPRRCAIP